MWKKTQEKTFLMSKEVKIFYDIKKENKKIDKLGLIKI